MDATVLLQVVINGISMGSIYALVACGLTLIFGVMNIINMAHGHFLMLAMYAVLFGSTVLGLDPYLSFVITVPFLLVMGILAFVLFIQPILDHPPMNKILMTLGLALVMENLALIIFSPDLRTVDSKIGGSKIAVYGAFMATTQIIAFLGSVAMALVLSQIIQRTWLGRCIRAASENPDAATLMGVNVRRICLVSFSLGILCLGVAAPLLVPLYYISPTIGNVFVLTAFVVVVLGGMGSFKGALWGGFIIGLTEAAGYALLPIGSLAPALIFVVFIGVLLFRPQGLFGERMQR
jgi:branched-chain amino acid transport system permease protein